MRLKSLALSVLVLAVLAAAAYLWRRPGPPLSADPRLNQTLLDRATAEKAAKVRISDQGKTVVIDRQPDGTWRVASYYDLPADFSKLTAFIGSLTDAKLPRLVTTNPERIARLDFKDTSLALLDPAGQELWSLTLGKTPETGGGRFVRFGAESKAYLADFNGWIDPEAKNWASSDLVAFKPENVARIEIPSAAGGPVILTRSTKEAAWTAGQTPAGQKPNASRIASLLSSLGTLRFSDTNDPADPGVAIAQANLRTFTLTTFDHRTITVALGRKPEEKRTKPAAASPNPGAASPATPPVTGEGSKNTAGPGGDETKPAPAKSPAPEIETIPAGPVFVFIQDSDSAAPINALMKRRAFQVPDDIFTGLPQKLDELFEAAPATVAPKPAPAP